MSSRVLRCQGLEAAAVLVHLALGSGASAGRGRAGNLRAWRPGASACQDRLDLAGQLREGCRLLVALTQAARLRAVVRPR
jgi:hypothetical protein